MLDINVCEKLLIRFSQFKPTDRKPTWMEICSFPQQRFEEICSRILKFFLKPDNPHGMKDLFIRSLEQCLSEKCMDEVVRVSATQKWVADSMSLLPAGYWERTPNGALHFYNIEMQTNFWMAKQYSDDGKKALGVWIASSGIHRDSPALKSSSGFSIRCVKNY